MVFQTDFSYLTKNTLRLHYKDQSFNALLSNWLSGAESFLRSCQSLRYKTIFPTLLATIKFTTVITRALHCSLCWARWVQAIPPHPIFLMPFLILSSHLRLVLPSSLFLLTFPSKSCMHSAFSHACYKPHRSHRPHSNYILRIVDVWSSSIWNFL
jgi:hypothetical protein